ncbi:hypothetical protein KP509_19G039600 [Ceratopteris richardii]|uniref:CCHC-type domain-containing protein n=1 Tax=Ceratopteris richardii TaxID=49495 RepID=A0A8T2SNQ5_CERRI|nr:hypothetical protein KP509_19G039600 [Ceratopteris richardii]
MENAYEQIVASLQSLQQQVEDLTHPQTQVEMGHQVHVGALLQDLQERIGSLQANQGRIQANQQPSTSFMKEPKICMLEKFDGDRTKETEKESNKLCLYCGNPGHIAVNCPNKRTNSRVAATLGLIIPATPIKTCLATAKFIIPKKTLSLTTLVDLGASSLVDGRPLASRNITMETTPFRVHLGDHESHICFNSTSGPIHLVIIGMPWLKKHNPNINWEKVHRCYD